MSEEQVQPHDDRHGHAYRQPNEELGGEAREQNGREPDLAEPQDVRIETSYAYGGGEDDKDRDDHERSYPAASGWRPAGKSLSLHEKAE